MKNLKKKLAGFLVFAMVLGMMAPGAVTVVKAADDAAATVTINYSKEEATITGAYDEILYAECKKVPEGGVVASGDSINVEFKDSDWETAEASVSAIDLSGEASVSAIDLSWVSKKKDTTLVFRLTKDKNVTYYAHKFEAQIATLKVGFAANASSAAIKSGKTTTDVPADKLVGSDETGYLFFYYTTGKDKTVEIASPDSISWKKGTTGKYASVLSSAEFAKQLTRFKAKGATLYFQITGSADKWASNEAKYSYKKQANAPAVKLDVTKHTIALKAGQEYMVVGAGGSDNKWVNVEEAHGVKDAKGKVSAVRVEELLASSAASNSAIGDQIYSKNLKVKVRTAANKTKGVIPSKTRTTAIEIVSDGAAGIGIGVATNSAVQVSYTIPYMTDKGVTLTNTTDTAYEFAYVASGKSIDATTKWSKLAGKKDTKNGTAKITRGYDKDGSIFIRLPGEKKAIELAGKATELKMENVKAVVQSVKSAELKTGTATGVSITNATPNAITLTVASGTAADADVTIEVNYEFTGLALTKETSAKQTSKDRWPTDVKVTAPKIGTDGKTTLTIVVKKGVAKATTAVTYEIQSVEFSVTLITE